MGNSYANLKKKDLLAIVADSSRTELETALAVKCLRLEKEVGQLNDVAKSENYLHRARTGEWMKEAR